MNHSYSWWEIAAGAIAVLGMGVAYFLSGDVRADLQAARHPVTTFRRAVPVEPTGKVSWLRAADRAYLAMTWSRLLGPAFWGPLVFITPLSVPIGVWFLVVPGRSLGERLVTGLVTLVLVSTTYLVFTSLMVRMRRIAETEEVDTGHAAPDLKSESEPPSVS